MSNIPVRFRQAGGLEATGSEQTQTGLLELRNVALDLRDVVQKRDGSEQVALTTGGGTEDVLDPVGLQAVAFRREELVVWSDRSLYSRSRCAPADSSDAPVGAASDAQVTEARSAAAVALRARQSVTLAGHPDANSVSLAAPDARPAAVAAAGGGVTCTVARLASGELRATFAGSTGGFPVVGSPLQLLAAGSAPIGGLAGTDVRCVYVGDHAMAGGTGAYFAAAWRELATGEVRWVIFQPAFDGFDGVRYTSEFGQLVPVANRPYDLALQDTVTDGALPTLVYFGTSSQVSARSRELGGSWATLLQRDVALAAGVAVIASDVVRALPDALTTSGQTAALFVRRSSQNEYRPLRFDAAFTQRRIRIPPASANLAPRLARSADGSLQLVGARDAATSGLHVFSGSTAAAPQWVAAVASGGSGSLLVAHVVECEQSATQWLVRRDGLACLTVTQSGGEQRALLARGSNLLALVSAAPVLRRWSWQPAPDGPTPAYAVVASTSGHLAAGQSANRVAYAYASTDPSRVEVVSSADALAFSSSGLQQLPAGEIVARSAGDLEIDTETAGDGVTATWFYVGSFGGELRAARRSVTTALAVSGAPLSTACQSSVSSLHAQTFVGFRLVVLNVQPASGQVGVTYEFGADYVLQVDPRLVTLPAGNFGRRGPWTAARARQELPIQGIGGGTVVACDVGEVQGCRALLWQVSGGAAPGIYFAIASDHLELPGGYERVDATGTRPQVVVNHEDGSALLTYCNAGGTIQKARWTPASSSVAFASAGFTPISSLYTTLAVSTRDGSPRHKYVIVGRAASPQHRVQRLDAGTLAVLFDESFTVGGTWSASSATLAVAVESSSDDEFVLRGCHPDAAGISTWRLLLPDGAGGSIVTSAANSYTVLPTNVARLAIASPDGTTNYHLLVEVGNQPGVHLASNASTEPASLRRRYYRHSIWTAAYRADDDKTYAVLAGGYGGFNAMASYWLIDLDTTEIVGRAFAEEGENSATRSGRLTTGHLSTPSRDLAADVSRVLYAAAVQLRGSDTQAAESPYPNIADLVGVGISATEFDDATFAAAELDGVLVHAHAGYARCYAGDLPHEHDFHCWPIAVSVTTPAGGSLSAGDYNCIVMYEGTDAQGHVYRSFGSFLGPVTAAANDRFDVVTYALSMTERRDVNIVLWRTTAGGSEYFRDVTLANDPDASTSVTLSGTQSDVNLSLREVLDLSLVPRNPGPATDLVSVVGGRFWTRDPERGSLARYTTPRAEGLAPWWSFAQGLEVPSQRDVTAIGDLDGRVVLFTALDLAVAGGAGPSATGQGFFQGPDRQPVEIGARAQTTIAEIPQGLVFGAASGPRLLNRALETSDVADQVYRYFEADGYEVTRCLYLPAQATLLVSARRGDEDLVLRVHVVTGRWAEDTGRSILDMATSRSGVVAYLGRDGRLLLEGDALLLRYQNLLALRSVLGRYPTWFLNGSLREQVTGAEIVLEGGAFLANDLDSPGVFNRTSYESSGADGDSVALLDASIADLGAGNPLAIFWSQTLNATGVFAGIVGKQTTLGADPFTGFRIADSPTGVSVAIDPAGADPGTAASLTATSSTVGERRWFCAVIDFVAGVVRIGSDLEAEVASAIEAPDASYETAAPLRVLDVRDNTMPPIDGLVHWAAFYVADDLADFVPDCNAVAQLLRAADEDGSGVAPIAALADRTDGEHGYVTSVRTPWLREPTRDAVTHPGFTFLGAAVFGTYLGSHDLLVQVFYDFADEPALEILIPRSQIDDQALAGRPYIYRVEQQDARCFAVSVRFADTGEPNPTFRAEGIDVFYKSDGARPAELRDANVARSTT